MLSETRGEKLKQRTVYTPYFLGAIDIYNGRTESQCDYILYVIR